MSEETKRASVKWYYRPVWVVIAVLAAGPFALPLVWLTPAFRRWLKVLVTALVVILTIWMVKASVDIYRILLKEIAELQTTF